MSSRDRTPTADLSGQFIDNGKILLLESIGSGGFGRVYKAVDTRSPPDLPVFYAVKCMFKPRTGSRQAIFQSNEFSLHQHISGHPHIVTFVKTFSDDSHVFVVLELATGGDLFHALTKKKILASRDDNLLKMIFIQVVDALRHCHQKGVYHRDIKPDNILCKQDGTGILLADFGLSSSAETSRDFRCGSANYMSPECIGKETNKAPYSHKKNDIWALGVLLTNMISNRHPWHIATSEDPCYKAYLRDPDWLRQMLPISTSAAKIIRKIFVTDPTARISLPQLRKEILAIETFFRSSELPVILPPAAAEAPVEEHPAHHKQGHVEHSSKSISVESIQNFSGTPLSSSGSEMDIVESKFAGQAVVGGDASEGGMGIRLVGAYRKLSREAPSPLFGTKA